MELGVENGRKGESTRRQWRRNNDDSFFLFLIPAIENAICESKQVRLNLNWIRPFGPPCPPLGNMRSQRQVIAFPLTGCEWLYNIILVWINGSNQDLMLLMRVVIGRDKIEFFGFLLQSAEIERKTVLAAKPESFAMEC